MTALASRIFYLLFAAIRSILRPSPEPYRLKRGLFLGVRTGTASEVRVDRAFPDRHLWNPYK